MLQNIKVPQLTWDSPPNPHVMDHCVPLNHTGESVKITGSVFLTQHAVSLNTKIKTSESCIFHIMSQHACTVFRLQHEKTWGRFAKLHPPAFVFKFNHKQRHENLPSVQPEGWWQIGRRNVPALHSNNNRQAPSYVGETGGTIMIILADLERNNNFGHLA